MPRASDRTLTFASSDFALSSADGARRISDADRLLCADSIDGAQRTRVECLLLYGFALLSRGKVQQRLPKRAEALASAKPATWKILHKIVSCHSTWNSYRAFCAVCVRCLVVWDVALRGSHELSAYCAARAIMAILLQVATELNERVCVCDCRNVC